MSTSTSMQSTSISTSTSTEQNVATTSKCNTNDNTNDNQNDNNIRQFVNIQNHPIDDPIYTHKLQNLLTQNGVITLPSFLLDHAKTQLLQEALTHKHKAYYTTKSHSVYLQPQNPLLPPTHPFNHQVHSSKGCITTDQIPSSSLLKQLYYDTSFQTFCANILGIDQLYPYDDPLSEINIHYYDNMQELGWHFDNSSFAITLLLQAPEGGGEFEYVSHVRDSSNGDDGYDTVSNILNGTKDSGGSGDGDDDGDDVKVQTLQIDPATLVLFRGRDCLHRVTKVEGSTTRVLVVLAYNDQPGVCLSEEARLTFFGRTGIDG